MDGKDKGNKNTFIMLRSLNAYEAQVNQRDAAQVEASRMRKRILQKQQKAPEGFCHTVPVLSGDGEGGESVEQ